MGRAEEQAAIQRLLGRARAGRGGGLCLRGEPGIGKSALLRFAAEQAAGMRVLRTEGVQPEAEFAYATLHRLLLPVTDLADRLPDPQRRALSVAFGESDRPAPDRFLVALATLSLLSEAADESPLLCLVDDVHSADPATLDVLTFVARRLEEEPVAVVVATRADGDGVPRRLAGLDDVPVTGLDDEAAGRLLDHHDDGRLTTAQASRVLAVAGGNPLALRELPEAMLRGGSLQDPLPLTKSLQDAFLDRVRRHDEQTQRVLLLIAADGSGRPETIRAAAGLVMDPVTSGELDDLVGHDGSRLRFHHPLMRAAIYHAAAPAERASAHRALADALHDDPSEQHRRAWHLGQAADGRDERAAQELERSASQAARRAGQAAAAAALARAAELSESDDLRGRRLVAAAFASWHDGDVTRAVELLDQAETIDQLPEGVRLDIAELRAQLESLVGTPADALAHLRPVIPYALRADTRRAMPLLLLYGEVGYKANLPGAWGEIADWLEPVHLDGDTPDDALHRLLRGSCRARSGRETGLRDRDLELVEQLSDPVKLCRAAGISWGLGEYELGRRLRHKSVRQVRSIGAAGTLAWVLEFLVFDELVRSRFSTAEAYAEEGHRLAVETGQPNTACRHQGMLTWLAALQGRATEARTLAEQVFDEASKRQLVDCLAYAHLGLGQLDLVEGRLSEAIRHFESVPGSDVATMQSGLVMHMVPELIEACARSNQLDRANEQLDRFTRWTSRTSSPELRALTARCRALVTSGPEAEHEFVESLKLYATTDAPMARARTELLLGEHLRRSRRRSEAQPHLQSALETFRRIGARAWEGRSRDELRAAGGADPHGDPMIWSMLTPQERRIALAVGDGATNREVAAQLFLSPRTVDYHLRKVFQKLGISSRTELVRLALTDQAGAE